MIDQGFDPKPNLLSERLGVTEREIVDMDQRLNSNDLSLDAPLKNESDTERIDFLATTEQSAESQVAKKEMETILRAKVSEFRLKLNDRERLIFDNRIFSDSPITLQEIGDNYGISRERVRQVEKNVIKKMKDFFRSEIKDFDSFNDHFESDY
ncbi:MAG: RNA polymerase sigma-32 factor [Candidatus Magnetoglobus multicellularis str. Araruama]|uniref:RNA polymerase sigma-32 factor n=1 Tax=Candidatus Magnetoglobus multicellularis str. Araruama TaxID=890399 RepID=A0A1V1PIA6_9BACT|nr:MAG: RNA polymerase sigma-32 factor [Candidatus Magnetoglobus multicellularis str. Araruama]